MEKKINMDALQGICITAAMYRCNWVPDTTACEMEDANGWDEVAEMAEEFASWIGYEGISVIKEDILEAVWGMELNELDC